MALSVVLLVGSSLLLISFLKLQRTPPGFEPKGAAAAFVGAAGHALHDAGAAGGVLRSGDRPAARAAAGHRRRGRHRAAAVRLQPAVAVQRRRPADPAAAAAAARRPRDRQRRLLPADADRRSPQGRAFTADDREGAPGVCIINESLARRLFPGESALGKVLLRGRDAEIKSEIVGVIRDVKTNGLNAPAPDEIYYPMRQLGRPGMARGGAHDGRSARRCRRVIRAAVAAVDKDQPISFFATLETNVAQSLGAQRIVASLTTIFAGAGAGALRRRPLLGARLRRVAADAGDRHPDGARRAARRRWSGW